MYYILKIGENPWDIAILTSKNDLPKDALYLETKIIPEKPSNNENLILCFETETNSLKWKKNYQEDMNIALNKKRKIQQSKEMLANFLVLNPLYSNAHNKIYDYYNVTEEKQSLLTSEFMGYQVEKSSGLNSVFTWNAVGKPCEVWTEAEGIQLIKEIREYVKPLIKYQQELEVQINNFTTLKELEDVIIDYTTVHSPFELNNVVKNNTLLNKEITTDKVVLIDDVK